MFQSKMIFVAEVYHFPGLKSYNIICNELVGTTKSRQDFGFKKFDNNNIGSQFGRCGLNPFSEVIGSYEDPFKLGRGWWMDFSNEIQSPLLEMTFNIYGF